MKRIPIESETIAKFQNTMTKQDADYLTNFVIEQTNNEINPDQMPWFQGNIIYYNTVTDFEADRIISEYRERMIKAIKEVYNEDVYGHLTTLVLWKEGQWMGRHHDQGNPGETGFDMRDFTSVLYINDDYEGGNTFIRNDSLNDDTWRTNPNADYNDFISKPEQGTSILFYGDDRNAHGVEKVISGTRVAMTTWFSKNPQYQGK